MKKEFGVSFSNRGMQDLFARLGLRYTRPTYALNKVDPEKQAQFRKVYERLKKTVE